MFEVTFTLESNDELWELLDKKIDNIFIQKFNPNEVLEWWKTTIKLKNGDLLDNIEARLMNCDIQTDLNGLRNILKLNSYFLNIYQFDKKVPNTLVIEHLPTEAKTKILQTNGLKHFFFSEYEFLTIGSFDEEFIKMIEDNPKFKNRIIQRNSKAL